MVRHVIWDIDNTMIASGEVFLVALRTLLLEEKGIELTEELHQHLVGLPTTETLAYLGFSDIAAAEKRWNDLIDADLMDFRIYDGVLETVAELHRRGIPLGIVSSRSDREMYDESVQRLLPYFGHVVLATDVARPKPYPDALELYCARAGVSPENLLYVGDGPADSLCCEALGVEFALALWGCIQPEKVAYAQHRLNRPEEVLGLVLGE